MKWLRKAAEQDETLSQIMLGNCYKFGRGVSIDTGEAFKWYSKAYESDGVLSREIIDILTEQDPGS